MKIAIIDNYDSFTYNLRHLVNELGAEVTVMRNDRYAIGQLEPFDKLIFSPGPGIPSEAGLMPETIKAYAGRKPMLGVCLGHQAIGEAFGARLTNLSEVFHGVATEGTQLGNDYIFGSLPHRITMGRYHSWVVSSGGTRRMPRGDGRERRRTDNGPEAQKLRHTRHPVPSRKRAHATRTHHHGQLARRPTRREVEPTAGNNITTPQSMLPQGRGHIAKGPVWQRQTARDATS